MKICQTLAIQGKKPKLLIIYFKNYNKIKFLKRHYNQNMFFCLKISTLKKIMPPMKILLSMFL
jgi:hypothetical protein